MDDNFPQVRKNLNILSVLILILAFSNAQIDKINFLGLQLELEGERLYIGLYIIYAYFIWRYFTKLPYSEFKNGFHTFLIQAKDGMLSKFTFEKYRAEFLDASEHLSTRFSKGKASTFSISLRRPDAKSLRKYVLICDYVFELTPAESKTATSNMEKSEISKTVSRWFLTRKFFWFCIKYDKFGDYLFPFIPIIVFLLFFFFSSDWQGSFAQLVPH